MLSDDTALVLFVVSRPAEMASVPPLMPSALTRDPKNTAGTYSPSGIWGDATLATRAKGKIMTEALVAAILSEIEQLRRTPLPAPAPPN